MGILAAARTLGDGPLVFPSRSGRRLDVKQLCRLLERCGIAALPHGFRSSFRDWAAEETDHLRMVVEAALAHMVQNPVEAAYARSDLFERRRLMDDWEGYLTGERGAEESSRRRHRTGRWRSGPVQIPSVRVQTTHRREREVAEESSATTASGESSRASAAPPLTFRPLQGDSPATVADCVIMAGRGLPGTSGEERIAIVRDPPVLGRHPGDAT